MTANETLDKYPRTKKFLEQHPGMTIDQALTATEIELGKLEKSGRI